MSRADVSPPALAPVASYRRTVGASLERVWENVHDWEHLPWLHHSSFASVELGAAGDWGWRARVGLQPAETAGKIEIELVRADDRYVVRTLEGGGAGSEVWTRLEPLDGRRTAIEVDFFVPGADPERRADVGRAYTRLYRQLWREDEGMMRLREARLGARPEPLPRELALGKLDAVRPCLPLTVELGGRPVRVIELDGELLAHSAVCAHLLGPLEETPVEDGCVRCPWHGYRYDVRTGRSADGRGLRLAPAPRVEVDPATSEVRLVL